ncbi:MAG: FliA/WhiG family RNA polymerase sigma factor [Solirubrobacterales bacterium]
MSSSAGLRTGGSTTTAKSRKAANAEAQKLWERYSRSRDPQLRDQLIFTFAPLVKYVVYRKVKELPARFEVDDFISCGLEALMGALDRYDPSKGATLEQFLWTRIHGAVIDELRRHDWAPRSLRRWERDLNNARDTLNARFGRSATEEELADAMGVDVATLRDKQHEIAHSEVTSLNSLVLGSDDDSAGERLNTIASDDLESDPEHATEVVLARERFREAFDALPEREREVAVLLYVKDLTLREIGEILGVTESRICQIHGQLKRRLREQLANEAQVFNAVA